MSNDPEIRKPVDIFEVEQWDLFLQQSVPIEKARENYEKCLEVFPTGVKYWKQYIDLELGEKNNIKNIEALFNRCLLKCLDAELWKKYLTYLINTKENEPDFDSTIEKAFEYAVEQIGSDVYASIIWMTYIDHLKSRETHNTYEESQKITLIRKIYQRAVVLPIINVDILWRDYDTWEHLMKKDMAGMILAEHQPKHIQAKVVSQMRRRLRGVIVNIPARIPKSILDYSQLFNWQKFIEYEKTNPQHLNPIALRSNVCLAFQQALLSLRYYPEIWVSYAYWASNISHDEAVKIFEEGMNILNDNQLFHFVYADYQETRGNIKEAGEIYDHLFKYNTSPLGFIQKMRFLRRTQGCESFRKFFQKLLSSNHISYHHYIAAASIEHNLNHQPQIAANIFFQGFRYYSNIENFIHRYIDFLLSINDSINLRIVFEKALSNSTTASTSMWNRFVEFEKMFGDLLSLRKAENRRNVAFGQKEFTEKNEEKSSDESILDITDFSPTSILSLINNYTFSELSPCDKNILDLIYNFVTGKTTFTSNISDSGNIDSAITTSAIKPIIKPDIHKLIEFTPVQVTTKVLKGHENLNFSIPPAVLKILEILPSNRTVSSLDLDIDIEFLISRLLEFV